MRNKVVRFIKYPLYPITQSWIENFMVKIRFGGIIRCTVCGNFAPIYIQGENLRETCLCFCCKSTNRQRALAYVTSSIVSGIENRCVSSLRAFTKISSVTIYNTEAKGAIHNQLSKVENYSCSEYLETSYKSGEIINGIMHQDLMCLSFADESFDLVLSGDVFEHVPDPYKAHQEVHRVLKAGGRHIFTVPFYQMEFLDEDRVVIGEDSHPVFLKPPIYHVDPLRPEGALVYKIFSLEMLVRLREIGFRTALYHLHSYRHGILGSNAIVFEAVKTMP